MKAREHTKVDILKVCKSELVAYNTREIKDKEVPLSEEEKSYSEEKLKALILERKKSMRELTDSVELTILQKILKDLQTNEDMYRSFNNTVMSEESRAQRIILEDLLPKTTDASDVEFWLVSEHGDQIDKKQMSSTIKEIKEKFVSFDGKLASEIVKRHSIMLKTVYKITRKQPSPFTINVWFASTPKFDLDTYTVEEIPNKPRRLRLVFSYVFRTDFSSIFYFKNVRSESDCLYGIHASNMAAIIPLMNMGSIDGNFVFTNKEGTITVKLA